MPIYLASPKHCEALTAERPGIKCPVWSREIAQSLLEESLPMGDKHVVTRDGVAFVAQLTRPDRDIWHGYPEAWDNIELSIKKQWIADHRIKRKHLRTFKTRAKLRDEFGGSL